MGSRCCRMGSGACGEAKGSNEKIIGEGLQWISVVWREMIACVRACGHATNQFGA